MFYETKLSHYLTFKNPGLDKDFLDEYSPMPGKRRQDTREEWADESLWRDWSLCQGITNISLLVVFKILSFIMNMLTYSRSTQMQMYENMYNQHIFKDLIEAPAMNQLRLSPSPPGRGREGNIISRAGNNALEKEHIVIHFDICRGRAGRSSLRGSLQINHCRGTRGEDASRPTICRPLVR